MQSCVKTFLISSETHPQNLPLPTLKMHFDATFQPAIPGTWQEYFYTTLYRGSLSEMGAKLREYLLFSCRLTSSAKRPTKQVICIKKLMTTARPALRANVLTAGTAWDCHFRGQTTHSNELKAERLGCVIAYSGYGGDFTQPSNHHLPEYFATI